MGCARLKHWARFSSLDRGHNPAPNGSTKPACTGKLGFP
jgi:hypothetical protein